MLAISRIDSWVNSVTGLGSGGYDSRGFSEPNYTPRTSSFWETLFHVSPLAHRAVALVPDYALRRKPSIKSDSNQDAADQIDDAASLLWGPLRQSLVLGRLFGGALLVPLAAEETDGTLSPGAEIREWVVYGGGLGGEVTATLRDSWGHPEEYWVGIAEDGGFGRYKSDRVILARGAETSPRFRREKLDGWDQSILQRPLEEIRDFETGWDSVWALLQESSLSIYKMGGLNGLMTGGNRAAVMARIKALNLSKSIFRGVTIDRDDSYERNTLSMAGIADVMREGLAPLSMATGIPQSILVGRSPAGFDATGESDFRAFYDLVEVFQTNDVRPRVIEAARLIAASLALEVPADLDVSFPPLWTPTAQEETNLLTAMATALVQLVRAGLLDPSEARKRIDGLAGIELDQAVDAELLAAYAEAVAGASGPAPVRAAEAQPSRETSAEGTPGARGGGNG